MFLTVKTTMGKLTKARNKYIGLLKEAYEVLDAGIEFKQSEAERLTTEAKYMMAEQESVYNALQKFGDA